MNARASLRLIAHAATHAMRAGRFPDDDPLDERGLAEAAALRRQWVAASDSIMLCSPARCALQTATALGLAAVVDEALRDVDYGTWRGKRLFDLARDMPAELETWIRDPSAAPHGGESFENALRRIAAWMDRLPIQGTIVAITHAAVIRAAFMHATVAKPNATSRIDIPPLSFVEFELSADGWKLIANSGRNATAAHHD
jgi:broad specificity phosphatase PhoE